MRELDVAPVQWYLDKSTSELPVTPSHVSIGEMRLEDVGDILYMKLVDGEVVDVEEEELDDVLQHIGHYL